MSTYGLPALLTGMYLVVGFMLMVVALLDQRLNITCSVLNMCMGFIDFGLPLIIFMLYVLPGFRIVTLFGIDVMTSSLLIPFLSLFITSGLLYLLLLGLRLLYRLIKK